MDPIRLQKHIADQGLASRREAERLILAGDVKVNGEVITVLGTKVDPEKDRVEVSGTALQKKSEETIYIMLHKPKGYVTTTHRTENEPEIVLDLLGDMKDRVYPVGRLDKESSGLLIFTNDGAGAFRLTHPSFEHEKEYVVETFNSIDDIQLKKLREGLPIQGQKTLPPKITRLAPSRFRIVLKEGKNRHIRRLMRKIGTGVKNLKRIRIGQLEIGDLPVGKFRILSSEEIKQLFSVS